VAHAWGWRLREPPLAPLAVVARGPVAQRLAARLLRREDAALGALAGVAGEGLLLLLGEADALPWEDGVEYLGRDPAAPRLLLPTRHAPDVPAALLERALLDLPGAEAPGAPAAGGTRAPLAVLREGLTVSARAARALSRERLASWAAQGGAWR
jgi:hypothetical protein